MKRKIIHIDEEKCNGCGACAAACHEAAIGMVQGKARLLRDDYCDGLGDCLPTCPTGAITFVEREAAEYDAAAVAANMAKAKAQGAQHTASPADGAQQPAVANKIPPLACGCPGTAARSLQRETAPSAPQPLSAVPQDNASELMQWPVQIKLVAPNAPYFKNAKLLVAADCTAYAYKNFHQDFIRGHVTLIGCPKLDTGEWAQKLAEILRINDIRSVTIARMEVPCCGGIEQAVKQALQASGKMIPWHVAAISTDGHLLEE